ncbi:phasin family protein [Reinekea marinisedimentorum]|uniref:Poly(Hydroxyalkanoate) granule-associated protein n=1 Tax=Reinekea marinisedimentorum TaxID=230495 RepID=A0A4V2UJY0_9GAMM|nr:phasin family protein [Reinekea marinisedimentorum]TCS41989.1 poly(hydroxyalkanoate) granule-associated protein [Reinekea marinisedimentorum]
MSKLSKNKLTVATQTTKDTARQMWMAGLGAFVKTGQEGGRLFSSLVEEGEQFQEKVSNKATDQVNGTVDSVMTQASGQWDKLEAILEDRVIKVLDKLGVPTKDDVSELIEKIDKLQAAVDGTAKKAPATRAKKPAAPKAVAEEKAAEAKAE